MSSTPSLGKMPSSPPTSSKNSMITKPATYLSRPPTRRFSMSHTPLLHLSKRSLHHPHSEYTSPQTAWGTTPQYPLGQLRPSSAWRTVTSPTQHAPLHTASSQWYDDAPPSPTNTLARPDTTLTNSPERYMPARPKSAASETTTGTPTCRPTLSATVDEWTSKCPPTVARMSSPSGSESWG